MTATTIIKIGGAVLDTDLAPLWSGISHLQNEGRVIVVHGGGPQSTQLARSLGHEPTIIRGRRVTDDIDLEIVKMALGGTININLVSSAASSGLRAVGISGISGGTVSVIRRPPWIMDGKEIDFGHVGDVIAIRTATLEALMDTGSLPIMACMGIDAGGSVYNVNADTVAAETACAFSAQRLFLVTASGGVRNEAGMLVNELSKEEGRRAVSEGWITDGMIVKVNTAIQALECGVVEVRITDSVGLTNPNAGTTMTEEIND